MGYFNYFIKCIIRNIAYKLCKPKVFLTVLLCLVILLFCFKNYGYCADESSSSEIITTKPTDQFLNGNYLQYDNNYLTLRSFQEDVQKSFITHMYAMKSKYPESAKQFVTLCYDIYSDQSNVTGLYIEPGNGGYFNVYQYYSNTLQSNLSMGSYVNDSITFVNVPYVKGTFYRRVIFSDGNMILDPVVHTDMSVPLAFLDVYVEDWIQLFKDFGCFQSDDQEEILQRLDTLISNYQQSNNEIANKIEEGNQLQQEQNQLQQEQNDFLKQESSDSDVSVDSFNSVDSNDITSDGLTGVFTNIYNSITSWSSKDIKLPIPFTNKNISIPANYTQNMLSSFGGSWIITFINSIYYFIVARFIIYSITGIVNSIKSGSILETDNQNNITTDML